MIEEELVEEEPVEEGREDMANDHGRERQSTGRQSIVKGKGLSIGERIKEYRLRLNPQKCTFGVTTGNLLGFFVTPQTQNGPKHEKRNSKVPMYFSFLTNQSR